jgi:hypothetical protein
VHVLLFVEDMGPVASYLSSSGEMVSNLNSRKVHADLPATDEGTEAKGILNRPKEMNTLGSWTRRQPQGSLLPWFDMRSILFVWAAV